MPKKEKAKRVLLREPKKRIVISFSGGETSAFMLQLILLLYGAPDYEIVVVFANTGEENEETLRFVKQCGEHFNVEVVWLEYERLSFKVVDFETAYRSHNLIERLSGWPNHPFRKMIAEFGIPNNKFPHCTRELKTRIIDRYLQSIGWPPRTCTRAIGIRADEIDRLKSSWYPLALLGVTKKHINEFWHKMPFRLELKGYEGNCKTCWKKSFRKLATIARYSPDFFDFMRLMEQEFGMYLKPGRKNDVEPPIRFFRENKSVDYIFELAADPSIADADDDSIYLQEIIDGVEIDTVNGCEESCEVDH